MITVELLNGADMYRWEEYVLKHWNSLFNASLKFRWFLMKLLGEGHVPFYLVANSGNEIVGVLPSFVKKGKRGAVLNSMPWFGSNPGIFANDEHIQAMLLQRFMDVASWTNCVSATFITRPFEDTDFYDSFFDLQGGYFIDERAGAMTCIPPYCSIDNSFDKDLLSIVHQKTRNQIKKSFRLCETSETTDMEFLKKTHWENMEAIGAPVKDLEFDIIKDLFEYDTDYKVFVSTVDGVPAAALLLKYYNKTVDYMTPAINVNFRHLNPLHILIFDAMKDAAKRGYLYWNWGGTTIPGQESVLHFKERFGANTCEYKYYTTIFDKSIMEATKEELMEDYKYFYVLPFSALKKKEMEAGK